MKKHAIIRMVKGYYNDGFREIFKNVRRRKMKYFARECSHITEQDVSSVTKALSKTIQDKNLMESSASSLKKMIDGEPVNVDPLTEIPESEMRLYFINEEDFIWKT